MVAFFPAFGGVVMRYSNVYHKKNWPLLHKFLGKLSDKNSLLASHLLFLQSHVPLNSSICQSEEGLKLFSSDPF